MLSVEKLGFPQVSSGILPRVQSDSPHSSQVGKPTTGSTKPSTGISTLSQGGIENEISSPGTERHRIAIVKGLTANSSQSLTRQIVVASVVSIIALAIVSGLGLGSIRRLSRQNDAETAQRLALLDESEVLQLLLYQKGFACDYMMTGNPRWLEELNSSRREFRDWLNQARANSDTAEETQILKRIEMEHSRLHDQQTAMIASFQKGDLQAVFSSHERIFAQLNDLVHLSEGFVKTAAAQTREERSVAQYVMRRDTWLLLVTSLLGMLTSLLVGFLVSRRIARPITALELQVASAVQKTRIVVPKDRAGLEALGDHIVAIVRKIEETDAAIAEQRRRLIQSEKMSAIGEVSAKLAHEVLNPLTGIKAAVQLLARQSGAEEAKTAQNARDTAQRVNQEIARIEQLVRRLLSYARPLQPRSEPCTVDHLAALALSAVRAESQQVGTSITVDMEPNLPVLTVDPTLITQALGNLLSNALQAIKTGGAVELSGKFGKLDGKPAIVLCVRDDGPGLSSSVLTQLFQPFFTTKPHGNGLGLALSQNIAKEHGGRIIARNRTGGHGAEFALLLPVTQVGPQQPPTTPNKL